jgi:exopolysaccharide production protein ExoZ
VYDRLMEKPKLFPGIYALRALAAASVVIQHAAFTAGNLSPYLYCGRFGVVLFFAISGFVIALQRRKSPGVFAAHRLLRIYPGYWLALLIEAVVFAMMGRPVGVSMASALLYPSSIGNDFTSIPYWTLAFEMFFYALATVAFAIRLSDRALTMLALLWMRQSICSRHRRPATTRPT